MTTTTTAQPPVEAGGGATRETGGRAPWIGALPWLAGLLLALVLVSLYRGNLHGPFLFDDLPAIVENPNIESLTPLWKALDAEDGNGADRRPLVALSLAVNYAFGERDPFGYHVFNLAVHILAAWTLFGLLRQAILVLAERSRQATLPAGDPRASDPGEARATLAAFPIALCWAVHPLHTSTLHMVINRNELLVGLFAFATLYGIARSLRSRTPAPWMVLAVVACWLGAASKEVMAAIPLVALLFESTLRSRGPRPPATGVPQLGAALRSHRVLYAGLASSWLLLAFLSTTGSRGESAGFGLPGFGPLDYLFTQTGALLHYLRLTFWPQTLAFDYNGWPVPESLAECWPAGLAVLGLLALALLAWRRGHVSGFLGLACFLVLSPSSSFIPLSGALVAEHRMYLPTAGLFALVACVLGRLLPSEARGTRPVPLALAVALGLGAAGSLAARTVVRNRDFESARTIWGATVDVRPNNARAWNSYGMALKAEGLLEGARNAYERALAIEPDHYRALVNLGNLHLDAKDWDGAWPLYERALARNPPESDVHYYLGVIAVHRGQPRLGVQHLRQAIGGKLSPPLQSAALQSLAWTLATAPDPELRDGPEALRLALELARRTGGKNPRVLDALAAAQAECGEWEAAEETASRALELARSRGQGALTAQIDARRRAYATGTAWQAGE